MKTYEQQILEEVRKLSFYNRAVFFKALEQEKSVEKAYTVLQKIGKKIGSPGLPAHEGKRTLMTRKQYEGRLFDLLFVDETVK